MPASSSVEFGGYKAAAATSAFGAKLKESSVHFESIPDANVAKPFAVAVVKRQKLSKCRFALQ